MNNLKLILNKLNYQQNILVVGDLILDQYQYCHSNRLTPDKNKPIYDVKKTKFCLGGAANVAKNLSSLGVKVSLIGLVGEDFPSSIIKKLLFQSKISSDLILTDSNRPTSLKTRVINDGKLLFRIDSENRNELSDKFYKEIKKNIVKNVKKYDGCIISDYQKGVLTKKLCRFIISSFNELNKPVFVDPKGDDYSKYQDCTVITPNKKDLEIISKKKFGKNIQKMQKSGRDLYKKINCKNLVVTAGSKGMICINDKDTLYSATTVVSKANTSGAGDTAISVIALSFLSGFSWDEIIIVSNFFCGLALQKPETSFVSHSEINTIKF